MKLFKVLKFIAVAAFLIVFILYSFLTADRYTVSRISKDSVMLQPTFITKVSSSLLPSKYLKLPIELHLLAEDNFDNFQCIKDSILVNGIESVFKSDHVIKAGVVEDYINNSPSSFFYWDGMVLMHKAPSRLNSRHFGRASLVSRFHLDGFVVVNGLWEWPFYVAVSCDTLGGVVRVGLSHC